jgi:hypothetical protein
LCDVLQDLEAVHGDEHRKLSPYRMEWDRALVNVTVRSDQRIVQVPKVVSTSGSDAPGPERSWLDRATGAPCA